MPCLKDQWFAWFAKQNLTFTIVSETATKKAGKNQQCASGSCCSMGRSWSSTSSKKPRPNSKPSASKLVAEKMGMGSHQPGGPSVYAIYQIIYLYTWWLIPLSKWVITPVINGISRVNPLITGVITHLLSGMSHQVPIQSYYPSINRLLPHCSLGSASSQAALFTQPCRWGSGAWHRATCQLINGYDP